MPRYSAIVLLLCSSTALFAEDSLESKHLSNIRQVTKGMTKAGEGYFSPDGRSIIYQAVPQDYVFYQIYTQPLSGGAPKRISSGRGRTTCSYFSPDGKRMKRPAASDAATPGTSIPPWTSLRRISTGTSSIS